MVSRLLSLTPALRRLRVLITAKQEPPPGVTPASQDRDVGKDSPLTRLSGAAAAVCDDQEHMASIIPKKKHLKLTQSQNADIWGYHFRGVL